MLSSLLNKFTDPAFLEILCASAFTLAIVVIIGVMAYEAYNALPETIYRKMAKERQERESKT